MPASCRNIDEAKTDDAATRHAIQVVRSAILFVSGDFVEGEGVMLGCSRGLSGGGVDIDDAAIGVALGVVDPHLF
ncbi:hypothetical protein ADLECEL_04380 [Adlercreutzia equolifaciens subsp. celatus]|nr:hypothetical protein ADLECEL_04380 [Adlercreutzia equolifaciens subsp. celatus]